MKNKTFEVHVVGREEPFTVVAGDWEQRKEIIVFLVDHIDIVASFPVANVLAVILVENAK